MLSAHSVTRSEPHRPCWADIVMANLGTSRVEAVRGEGGFFGELGLANLGFLRIAHVTLRGAAVRGMRRRGGSGGRQSYSWLAVSLGGGFELAFNSRSAVMAPGGMAILDARRTYVTTFAPDSEVLWVRVPQAFVQSQLGAAAQITIDGTHGAGRILFDAVKSVWTQAAQLDAAQGRCVADGLVTLMTAACIGREVEAEQGAALSTGAAIATPAPALQRVKGFILENLADESLSASSVAGACGLTARYINKLFEREGMSLMRWVWHQRLQAARAALAELHSRSIGDVAYAYGFKSASHFSHAFRRCFGHPPRAERHCGAGP